MKGDEKCAATLNNPWRFKQHNELQAVSDLYKFNRKWQPKRTILWN